MKIVKQILSSILCASVLSSCIMTTYAAKVTQVEPEPNTINDPCPWDKRNKYNQYIELNCQKILLTREIRKNPGTYQKREKLGPEGNHTLYAFSYKSMATFVDEFSRELNQAHNKLIAHQILKKSAEKVRFLFGLSSSEAEEVVSILYKSITGNNKGKVPNIIKKLTSDNKEADSKSISQWSFKGAIGGAAIIGGAATAAMLLFPPAGLAASIGAKVGIAIAGVVAGGTIGAESAGYSRATSISNQHLKESQKQRIIIDNCVSAISQILSSLKYDFWKSGDVISIVFNNDQSSNYATVGFDKVGLNYTQDDNIKIEKMFEDSKVDLQKFLDKYDEQ